MPKTPNKRNISASILVPEKIAQPSQNQSDTPNSFLDPEMLQSSDALEQAESDDTSTSEFTQNIEDIIPSTEDGESEVIMAIVLDAITNPCHLNNFLRPN
jgi:hypothetical protein